MKIKNTSKRLIVLNFKVGKGFKSLPIGAGETVENESLTKNDIAFYVEKKSIEILEATVDSVVLPVEVTAETLKAMAVKDLRRYCKENDIEVPKGSKEDDIVALILDSVQPKE